MGFGTLRVLNEERLAPGAEIAPQRRANMEILDWVVDGALVHRDASGAEHLQRAGELRWTGAGHGIEYAARNASATAPAHVLQLWIQPDRVNAPPATAQRAFDPAAPAGRWTTLASPDGSDGSLAIRQRAWLHAVRLAPGEEAVWPLDPDRRCWLHLVQGAADVDGTPFAAGDALGITAESGTLRIIATAPSEILFFAQASPA